MSTMHLLDTEGAPVCGAAPRPDGSNVTSDPALASCEECLFAPAPSASATENATVTVTFGGRSVTFELDGTELALSTTPQGTEGHRYLSNASKDFISTEVEKALIDLVTPQSSEATS